jgi:hypothetical protein
MNKIQIPLSEYQVMKEELTLLRDSELLVKVNRLIDLLFQEKYGLFMQDYTEDLQEYAIKNAWVKEDSDAWDKV